LRGRWRPSGDNFVLRPLPNIKPRAVIHFIGGAFVGAAPHFAYRFLLDELADEGYVVVATPYKLSFNYIDLCSDISARFAPTLEDLDAEYGRLPTIGLGHSCGALLQALLSSLFPDERPSPTDHPLDAPADSAPSSPSPSRRIANILISYNNRPARDSIPQYEELVAPLARAVTADGPAQAALGGLIASLADSAEALAYSFARSRSAPRRARSSAPRAAARARTRSAARARPPPEPPAPPLAHAPRAVAPRGAPGAVPPCARARRGRRGESGCASGRASAGGHAGRGSNGPGRPIRRPGPGRPPQPCYPPRPSATTSPTPPHPFPPEEESGPCPPEEGS
jgi:hypothetical protein